MQNNSKSSVEFLNPRARRKHSLLSSCLNFKEITNDYDCHNYRLKPIKTEMDENRFRTRIAYQGNKPGLWLSHVPLERAMPRMDHGTLRKQKNKIQTLGKTMPTRSNWQSSAGLQKTSWANTLGQIRK